MSNLEEAAERAKFDLCHRDCPVYTTYKDTDIEICGLKQGFFGNENECIFEKCPTIFWLKKFHLIFSEE